MKGISEIIATILMLMITLGISGTAYVFISGAFTQQTQGLEMVDAYCQDGAPDVVNLIMRNIGTVAMTTSSFVVIQSNPTEPAPPLAPNRAWVGGITSIPPGTIATLQDACEGAGSRSCIYRITPPAGRSVVASVSCS